MNDHAPFTPAPMGQQRADEGLETAGPKCERCTEAELAAVRNTRPMTKRIEMVLSPRLIELIEKSIETRYDRLQTLQNVTDIVIQLNGSPDPAASERYQEQLIKLYEQYLDQSPVEVVSDVVRKEVRALPRLVISSVITTAIVLILAYICVACGLPPVL